MEIPYPHEHSGSDEDALRELFPDADLSALMSNYDEEHSSTPSDPTHLDGLRSETNTQIARVDFNPFNLLLYPEPTITEQFQVGNSFFDPSCVSDSLLLDLPRNSTEAWSSTGPGLPPFPSVANGADVCQMLNQSSQSISHEDLTIQASNECLHSPRSDNIGHFDHMNFTNLSSHEVAFNDTSVALHGMNVSEGLSAITATNMDPSFYADPEFVDSSVIAWGSTCHQQPNQLPQSLSLTPSMLQTNPQPLLSSTKTVDDFTGDQPASQFEHTYNINEYVDALTLDDFSDRFGPQTTSDIFPSSDNPNSSSFVNLEHISRVNGKSYESLAPSSFEVSIRPRSKVIKKDQKAATPCIEAGQAIPIREAPSIPQNMLFAFASKDIQPKKRSGPPAKLKEMRDLGACILCKLSKTRCSNQTPCKPCRKPMSKDMELGTPRSWGFFDCVRERFSDLDPCKLVLVKRSSSCSRWRYVRLFEKCFDKQCEWHMTPTLEALPPALENFWLKYDTFYWFLLVVIVARGAKRPDVEKHKILAPGVKSFLRSIETQLSLKELGSLSSTSCLKLIGCLGLYITLASSRKVDGHRNCICGPSCNGTLDRFIFLIRCLGHHAASRWSPSDPNRAKLDEMLPRLGCWSHWSFIRNEPRTEPQKPRPDHLEEVKREKTTKLDAEDFEEGRISRKRIKDKDK